MDHRDELIQRYASGRSFADIGGLWGEVNEKGSVAAIGGATDVTMVDIWPETDAWWPRMRQRFRERDLSLPREIIGSIDNPRTLEAVGKCDLVHCSGVLYHCPNSILTLRNLITITGEFLIVTSAVMPQEIRTDVGELTISNDAPIFVPALSDDRRRILAAYIKLRYGGGAWGIDHPLSDWFFADGAPNYGPWWWLWTAPGFLKLLETVGLEIVDERSQFDGTGHLAVCRIAAGTSRNYSVF